MSKQHPNQDYYKTGGSSQSEGPDRAHVPMSNEKPELPRPEKNPKHPAVMRAKKK